MATDQYPKAYLYMRIVQAKLFMDKNYSEQIDLDRITGEAFFSKYHFIRKFGKIYGMTPYQYLKKIRIQKAKELFRLGHTIKDVCQFVGFQSVSTFVGLFKKEVGQTPTAFCEKYVQDCMQIKRTPLKLIPACFAERDSWK